MQKKNNMICTTECEKCIHSDISTEKMSVRFHCNAKDKDYIYGQYIPCNQKESRKDEATM